MGYSCAAKASYTLDCLWNELQKNGDNQTSNSWTFKGERYFFEQGREQHDGSITGQIMRFLPDGRCRRVGSGKVNSDGSIARWAFSTKDMRQTAEKNGAVKYSEIHERPSQGYQGPINWPSNQTPSKYTNMTFTVI